MTATAERSAIESVPTQLFIGVRVMHCALVAAVCSCKT